MPEAPTSRLPGFYRLPLDERVARLTAAAKFLSAEARAHLCAGGGLPLAVAEAMSENVVACHGLPLSVGLNFRVNRRDVLVPMAVEEPSVVAAASGAARLVRMTGGFTGEATAPVMTAQVQLEQVEDPAGAPARLAAAHDDIVAAVDGAVPRLVARGGGLRDVEGRTPGEGMVVVHLHVDVGDAMGANLIDTVAEAAAPLLAEIVGGEPGLRILTNLPLRRMVRVSATVPASVIGDALADAVARASRFAEIDPFRAVTHNKGIMNGVDAVAVATGQDFRAIEAAAHGYAALGGSGGYRPLATWRRDGETLRGDLEMPLAVGTVGGSTHAHPGARVALELLAVEGARELAVVMAAVGLASNLAALRALAGEGIQRGHMRLHARKQAAVAGRASSGGAL